MRSKLRFFLAPVLCLLGAATLSAGCNGSPSVRDVCENLCSCVQECSESAMNDCVKAGEAQQKATEDAGCADTHAELRQCLVDNLECTAGGATLPPACAGLAADVETCLGDEGPG